MAIEKARFKKIVDFVIDNIEGGYYHPQMLLDGRVKDQRYSKSGETMFGIDRVAGADINKTPAGLKFWAIIDKQDAAHKWKWNYKGGSDAEQLKTLAGEIIYPEYERMSKRYLTPEAKIAVESDDRLLFNFVYGVWNGEGWFKKFAIPVNDSISKGMKDADSLAKISVATRKNADSSLIKQGGGKIEVLMNQLKSSVSQSVSLQIDEAKKHPIVVLLLLAGFVGVVYVGINYDKLFKK